MKIFKKIIIIIFILYLVISSLYIAFYIDFDEVPEIAGMGFSSSNNNLRIFMGIPPTRSTYEGVPPIFLVEVAIKVILSIFLIIYLIKHK